MIGRAYVAGPGTAAEQLRPRPAMLQAALELALPVLLLSGLLVVSYLYGDQPVGWFGPAAAHWLTAGHLLLPLSFFAIALTNRRCGAGYALAQVMVSWLLLALFFFAAPEAVVAMSARALPSSTAALAFGGGLLTGQCLSVLVFDRLRGPCWWRAPFFALLWGGLAFCAVVFPALYLHTGTDWIGRMILYAAIMAASATLLLLPYGFLRRMIPPRSGFGGY